MERRQLLQGLMAAPLVWPLSGLLAARSAPETGRRVVVVGAGAFGGWTAMRLAQSGAQVTLVERWTPGHALSSSGGETRVIRHMYANPLYVRMAARSLALYRQADAEWARNLFHPIGVLFLRQSAGAGFFEAGNAALDAVGIVHEKLDPDEVARRWPQLATDGIEVATYEPQAGYLNAQRACQAVHEAVERAGGRVVTGQARPGPFRSGRMASIVLADGSELKADDFVFACGPWMRELFADVLAPLLTVTRQDIYYFSVPSEASDHSEAALPVWGDFGDRLWYGIPGNDRRKFKIADDTRGAVIDPETSERSIDWTHIELAREYLRGRFPALADAELAGVQLCQYTNTGDSDFIVDRHPEAANLWLVGGGSGHGFKHGPALGELVADSVLQERPTEPAFELSRFDKPSGS